MSFWKALHSTHFKHAYHQSYFSSALFSFIIFIIYANCCTALIEEKDILMRQGIDKKSEEWDFKYAEGGTLWIEVKLMNIEDEDPSNENASFIYVLLCTDEQFDSLLAADDICSGKNKKCDIQEPIPYNGQEWYKKNTAKMTGWYKLFFLNCPGATVEFKRLITAINPGGEYLSLSEVPYPMLYNICTYVWLVLLIFWVFHVYQYRIWNVRLQKLMTIIPIFQIATCLLTLISWQEKSQHGKPNIVVDALKFQIETFYGGAEFTIFVLMAKGWMVTRGKLTRFESRKILLIIFLWVVSREAFNVLGSFSFIFLIIMYFFLIHHIFSNIKLNLTVLRRQIHLVRNFQLTPESPLLVKLRIFKRFQWALVTYILIPLVSNMIGTVLLRNTPWVQRAMDEAIEWGMAIALGYNFCLNAFAPCYYRIDDGQNVDGRVPSSMMMMYQRGLIWRVGMDRPDHLLDSGGWFGTYKEPTQTILVQHPGNGLSVAKPIRNTSDDYMPIPPPISVNTTKGNSEPPPPYQCSIEMDARALM